jgi:hypothetical protein
VYAYALSVHFRGFFKGRGGQHERTVMGQLAGSLYGHAGAAGALWKLYGGSENQFSAFQVLRMRLGAV